MSVVGSIAAIGVVRKAIKNLPPTAKKKDWARLLLPVMITLVLAGGLGFIVPMMVARFGLNALAGLGARAQYLRTVLRTTRVGRTSIGLRAARAFLKPIMKAVQEMRP